MNIKIVLFIVVAIGGVFAPPVTKEKEKQPEGEAEERGLEDLMEYHHYLKEVVHALESDPDFRQKLEKAEESDIRSGKIANELQFVSHHVRTRLDEIKRRELVRLRELKEQQMHLIDGNRIDLEDPTHKHLDHMNPHTFEIEDLKKLIAKSTEDLAEADRKRREEFKRYEMQKELDKREQLNQTTVVEEREKLEKQYKEMEEKHKKHEPLHEPGHKKQLEEVWEEQDHMDQEFEPKPFFMLHDLDGNGLWDQNEVKALFVKELDKMYSNGAPEDDINERAEEMERMREAVFIEMDVNRDGVIDFHEFEKQTKRQKFEEDKGWKGLDEQKPYTDDELQQYIKQEQMRQQQEQMYHQRRQQYQQQQQQHQQQYPPHYQQQPPQYQQHAPQYQQHGEQPPAYQQHQQQPPQYQQHQQQVPQYQQHQQQPPQHQQQAPQYQQHAEQPPAYQQHQQQPPQYQQHQQPPPQYQQQPPQHQQQPSHPQPPPSYQEHPNAVPPNQINSDKKLELNTGEVHPKQQTEDKHADSNRIESKPYVQH